MKKSAFIFTLMASIALSACSVMKTNTPIEEDYSGLDGKWELIYITGPRIAFDGLYPTNTPTLNIDLENKRVGGNNSCNSYGGDLVIKQDSIKIEKPFSTMMACPGNGESTFMKALVKIQTYKLKGDTLVVYESEIETMRFKKQ